MNAVVTLLLKRQSSLPAVMNSPMSSRARARAPMAISFGVRGGDARRLMFDGGGSSRRVCRVGDVSGLADLRSLSRA